MVRTVTMAAALFALSLAFPAVAGASPAQAKVDPLAPLTGTYSHCNDFYPWIWCSPALANLNVRSGEPRTSSPVAFTIPKGDQVQLLCYLEGESVHGDNRWIQVNEGAQYVSDYYVATGSAADLKAHVDHC